MTLGTVLVIESNAIVASGLCDLLEVANYSAWSTPSHHQGFQVAREYEVNCVVLSTSRLTNAECFMEARRRDPVVRTVPVLALLLSSQRRTLTPQQRHMFSSHILMPFDPEEFLTAVRNLIWPYRYRR